MRNQSEITADRQGSVATVVGRGELDLGVSQRLWRELESAIATEADVAVDLKAAVFVDTAILACLARASRALRNEDKRLKVMVTDNSHPYRALMTVGFDQIMDLEVFPSD